MSGSTTSTTTNWDIAAFPPAPPAPSHSHAHSHSAPTVSKRHVQSHPGSNHHKRARQASDMPFPRRSRSTSRDSSGHHESGVPQEDSKRTVRRKKSSLDLRDIFLNGGLFPSGAAAAAAPS